MDPLTPTTSTLPPAIAHIAETASSLSASLQDRAAPSAHSDDPALAAERDKSRQRELVRWVLQAPARLRRLIEDGRSEDAEVQWREIQSLLEKWSAVQGADEVRRRCEEVFKTGDE